MKKTGKTMELSTTVQIESWRQRLNCENKISKPRDLNDLKKLEEELEMKNTYFHHFKQDDIKQKERDCEHTQTKVSLKEFMFEQFAYDQAKGEEENNYCKKCKYESRWCKHRKEREVAKQNLGAAITTTQQYGWREHYDTLIHGYNISGVCKRTFFDQGHLS